MGWRKYSLMLWIGQFVYHVTAFHDHHISLSVRSDYDLFFLLWFHPHSWLVLNAAVQLLSTLNCHEHIICWLLFLCWVPVKCWFDFKSALLSDKKLAGCFYFLSPPKNQKSYNLCWGKERVLRIAPDRIFHNVISEDMSAAPLCQVWEPFFSMDPKICGVEAM